MVPTIVPEGAETVGRTPEERDAIPVPEARFKSLPVVEEKRAISLSTEVDVLVEASPLPAAVQTSTFPEASMPKG